MPFYTYTCRECDVRIEVRHSMKERLLDCEKCNTKGTLVRLPSHFLTLKTDSSPGDPKGKPGELVNSFIEEAAEDLKGHKRTVQNKDYKKEC